jgi:hypothetical protein
MTIMADRKYWEFEYACETAASSSFCWFRLVLHCLTCQYLHILVLPCCCLTNTAAPVLGEGNPASVVHVCCAECRWPEL